MSDKLAVTIPPEPPEGSVFLDRLKRAWQRKGPVWCMAGAMIPILGSSVSALRWGQLLLDCGEGEVIWSPPSECGRDAAVIQNLTGAEDAATQAAARAREERAQAEARPHDQPAQLCANCKQRPPKYPGADDPIGGHYCDPCVDRCHEATEFDHVCAICRAPEPPAEPLRVREVDRG